MIISSIARNTSSILQAVSAAMFVEEITSVKAVQELGRLTFKNLSGEQTRRSGKLGLE